MTNTPREAPTDEVIAAQIHTPIDVKLELEDERWTIVTRRHFSQSPEKLWAMLTEPGPASCRENPGDDPTDAEVLVVNAPRQLVHRWGSDMLSWALTPVDEGTLLELRQTTAEGEAVSMFAAGWQICLGRLAADDAVERERPTGRRAMAYGWEKLRDQYERKFSDVTHARRAVTFDTD